MLKTFFTNVPVKESADIAIQLLYNHHKLQPPNIRAKLAQNKHIFTISTALITAILGFLVPLCLLFT